MIHNVAVGETVVCRVAIHRVANVAVVGRGARGYPRGGRRFDQWWHGDPDRTVTEQG
ncbi:hypothetical protein CLV68_4381 [Actinokineospora cianjurensis]|uniref:Uncharacterized protein n=1 Tax=Actinokineospora cianjurensis TaxID=585224 RepID=A0A421B1L6_9PSEU|nr:hypothetical protein CLV68_4381 [Actinokineospora cianjurensis]